MVVAKLQANTVWYERALNDHSAPTIGRVLCSHMANHYIEEKLKAEKKTEEKYSISKPTIRLINYRPIIKLMVPNYDWI